MCVFNFISFNNRNKLFCYDKGREIPLINQNCINFNCNRREGVQPWAERAKTALSLSNEMNRKMNKKLLSGERGGGLDNSS